MVDLSNGDSPPSTKSTTLEINVVVFFLYKIGKYWYNVNRWWGVVDFYDKYLELSKVNRIINK